MQASHTVNSVGRNAPRTAVLAGHHQAAVVRPSAQTPRLTSSVCSTSEAPSTSARSRAAPLHAMATAGPGAGPTPPNLGRVGAPVRKLDSVYDVVVVGGGISGLTTGSALQVKHGLTNFIITESRERVGGNITSLQEGGFTWEEGPNSFQPSDSVLQIAVDAGVEKDLVFGDPTAPRFVYWDKKLRPTPSGLDILTFDLVSIIGKIRAGLGAIGLMNGTMPAFEESVEQFIRRNLGAQIFERLIEPFCSGVYAGDPAKLSMKAAFGRIWILEKEGGSLVGGSLKFFNAKRGQVEPPRNPRLPEKPKGQTVGSFRNGLQTLPVAIGKQMEDKIRCNWKLAEIFKVESSGMFSLLYDTPEGRVEVTARTVALTVPAYVAAEILRREIPDATDALKSIDYPPVGAVTVSYPMSAIREERKDAATGGVPGFGQLHPRSQGVLTLGTLYSSSLFPNRCPNGDMLILNYIGGAKNRNILNQTHEQLVEQVDKDLRIMLINPDAPPPKVIGVRVWPKAIPQFNVGHGDAVAAAKLALDEAGWGNIMLGGNYVAGVALGKCVEYGYEYAAEIAKRVSALPALKQQRSTASV